MSGSISTLLRRGVTAAGLGFPFFGTTKTPLPKSTRLGGKRRALFSPQESGCLFDMINVWLDDEYGLNSIPSPPKTILDVGANIGIFSLWARHQFPSATIHAYEPNPRAFPYLQANLEGMNTTVFASGVGAEKGRADVVDHLDSQHASTVASTEGEIQIDSLAEAVERLGGGIDLVKIDCEGAEWDLFRDPAPFRKIRLLRMEYHLIGNHSLPEFKTVTNDLGFSIVKLIPNQGFGIAWLKRNDLQ